METQRDVLGELQAWYLRHCDGDWEHSNGITVKTLDNPGWSVEVDLVGTPAAERPAHDVKRHRDENDWVVSWKAGTTLRGACGPTNLTETLALMLDWLSKTS